MLNSNVDKIRIKNDLTALRNSIEIQVRNMYDQLMEDKQTLTKLETSVAHYTFAHDNASSKQAKEMYKATLDKFMPQYEDLKTRIPATEEEILKLQQQSRELLAEIKSM